MDGSKKEATNDINNQDNKEEDKNKDIDEINKEININEIKQNNKKENLNEKSNIIDNSIDASMIENLNINVETSKQNDINILKEKESESSNLVQNIKLLSQTNLKKSIYPHKEKITKLLILNDGRLASCSYDKTINIYNLKDFSIDFEIEEENKINYIYQLDDNTLIVCSNKIILYDYIDNEFKFKQQLLAHNGPIFKVCDYFDKDLNGFASLSEDKSIKIWYIKKPKNKFISLNTLKYINGFNSICQITDNIIASSNYIEKKIFFWNLKNKKIEKIINNVICSEGCDSLVIHENNLIVFGKGIYIINVKNLEIIKQYNFAYHINCISFIDENNIIYTGDNVGNLKEWKINGIEWIEMSFKEINNIGFNKENKNNKVIIDSITKMENGMIIYLENDKINILS